MGQRQQPLGVMAKATLRISLVEVQPLAKADVRADLPLELSAERLRGMGANNWARTIGREQSACSGVIVWTKRSDHAQAIVAAQWRKARRERRRDQTQHIRGRGQCRTHDSARGRPHGLCRRAHLRRLGAHRPLGYGEWDWGEGATCGTYSGVVDRRHRQRPRLVQRVLFWGRSMAPSRARRASTANRCVAHPTLGFGRRKWISRTRGTCRARRHMVWAAGWRLI